MKYLIPSDRAYSVIYNYLVDTYTPDYGWAVPFFYKKEIEGYNVVVIRGLRNSDDFDYEYTQSRYMWDQKPNVKIVYIPCDPLYTHISSSGYKALENIEKGSGYHYLAIEEGDK